MSTLSKHAFVVVLILTIVGLTAPIRAQSILPEEKPAVSQLQTEPSPPSTLSRKLVFLVELVLTMCLALVVALISADLVLNDAVGSRGTQRKVASTMSQKFLSSSKPADGSSTPRASAISADLQQIALQYTQVTGKGLIGGYSELLRQNSQGSLEAKGVDAAVRRLDNRDRIVYRLAQSIRVEDGLKEVTHQYELNEIKRELKYEAIRSGSPRTPSLPPAAAPASLPSPPVQPYASPDRLEGLALNGVLIYRTEGSESFARFAAALSNDLGRNEAAVVTRRMDEMLSKLDCV